MPASFIDGVVGADDGSGTTLDTSGALTLQDGDLVVTWSKWEGATEPTLGVASTTGTHVCSTRPLISGSGGAFWGGWAYLLSAGAGTITFRQTLSAARDFRRLLVGQFRGDPGDVWSFLDDAGAFGSSTAPNSTDITVTGDDLVVCGGYGEFAAATTSSELINGVAATEITGSPANFSSMWYRLVGAGFTGAASATLALNDWICAAIGFAAEPAVPVEPGALSLPNRGARRPMVFAPGRAR